MKYRFLLLENSMHIIPETEIPAHVYMNFVLCVLHVKSTCICKSTTNKPIIIYTCICCFNCKVKGPINATPVCLFTFTVLAVQRPSAVGYMLLCTYSKGH